MPEKELDVCPIHNQPLHACPASCATVDVGVEMIPNLDITKIESFLSPKQIEFFKKECDLQNLKIQSNGKIIMSHQEIASDDVLLWKGKEGVIDVTQFNGILVVLYNSHIKIPDGCRDFSKAFSHHGQAFGGAGYYDTKANTCFVDISSTYEILDEAYHPEDMYNIARHELRHGLVATADKEYSKEISPEIHRQRAYLDELHSQYFDALEKENGGVAAFLNINSRIYSTLDIGSHENVASSTDDGRFLARELFYLLQVFILSKRMVEQNPTKSLQNIIDDFSIAAGTVLGTEGSLVEAHTKVKSLWGKLVEYQTYREEMLEFIKKYQPNPVNNTPEVCPELETLLAK